MNVIFVLYGGVETNSFLCLSRFAKELYQRRHQCAAVLHGVMKPWSESYLRVYSPQEVFKKPQACFKNGKKADIVHAWTPRQNVCDFVLQYQALHPTPLFIYSEDDEEWIAREAMRLSSQSLCQKIKNLFCQEEIPSYLSDPARFRDFLGTADVAGVITSELQKDLPSGSPAEVLLPGVDLKEFSPRSAVISLRKKYHLDDAGKLIVYCGGVNQFTGPNIRDLCSAVMLLNQRGWACRLVRSGMRKLVSIPGIKKEELESVLDLEMLPASEIPGLMSLTNVFVQPGRPSPFEAGRLPCKIIEFMAMGVPTILPHCNVGLLVQERQEAMTHKTGEPEEMASLCEEVFNNLSLQAQLSVGARNFAEKYFDIQKNTDQLERLYQRATAEFTKKQS